MDKYTFDDVFMDENYSTDYLIAEFPPEAFETDMLLPPGDDIESVIDPLPLVDRAVNSMIHTLMMVKEHPVFENLDMETTSGRMVYATIRYAFLDSGVLDGPCGELLDIRCPDRNPANKRLHWLTLDLLERFFFFTLWDYLHLNTWDVDAQRSSLHAALTDPFTMMDLVRRDELGMEV